MNIHKGCLTFLETKTSEEELKTCLKVLKEFKSCESTEEWLLTPNFNWNKLEQLEDYLKILTNTNVEEVVNDRAKNYYEYLKTIQI